MNWRNKLPGGRLPAPYLLAIFFTVAGVLHPGAAHSRSVDMVLKKSISEDFKASREFRQYMVLPGDSLYRIFRRLGIPDHEMPDYLGKFLAGNPSVENADLIRPGQILMIPVFQHKPVPPRSSGGTVDPGEKLSGRGPPPMPEKSRPSTFRREAALVLAEVFAGMGEKIERQGTFHFPVKDHGSLTLDSGRFPMIGLESGTWLILDLEGSLPETVKELIETVRPGYRVLSLDTAETIPEILDMVLASSDFHSVIRKKKLDMGGDVRVILNCDWIIEKTPDSILDGEMYVLNTVNHPKELIPSPIRDYASRYSIKIMNLPGGEGPAAEDRSAMIPSATPPETLDWDSREELVDNVLERLGEIFQKDRQIDLFGGGDLGAELTFKADRYLVAGERRVAVSFEVVPSALTELLREMGIHHLGLGPEMLPGEIISSLLSSLNLRYFGPDIEFFQLGDEGEDKFVINIPGIFARYRGESLLFTGAAPDEHILSFLAGRGVRLILY